MNRMLDALEEVVRRAPATLVLLTVLVTAGLGVMATQTVQEQGFENFSPDNEVSAALQEIATSFSAGFDQVLVLVEPDDGPILSSGGVAAAVELRDRILGDPAVRDVLAPIPTGAVLTFADPLLGAAQAQGIDPAVLDDAMVVQLHQAALAALPPEQVEQASRLLATPRDGAALDGSDAGVGAVVVVLDGQQDQDLRDAAVDALSGHGEVAGATVTVFDFRLLADDISGSIEADLLRLLGLAFGLVVLLLIVIYRRAVDVLTTVLGLVFTIVWMQGIGALLGPSYLGWIGGMSEMSMAVPILLVALGVDYGIHLTMRYREERALHGDVSGAVTGAIRAVGAALVLATLTTAVGFLTNLVNPLPPLRDFGVLAAVGIGSAFLILTTFVPAVRSLVDRWRLRRDRLPDEVSRGRERPTLAGRVAASLAPFATRRPGTVLLVTGVLTVAGAVSATGLSTEFSQTEFFPDDAPALRTIQLVEEAFGGDLTESTQVLVSGDVDAPGVLAALDELERSLRDVPGVRQSNGRAETDSVLTRTAAVLELVGAGATGAPGDLPGDLPGAPGDLPGAPGELPGAVDGPPGGMPEQPGTDAPGGVAPEAIMGLVAAASEAGIDVGEVRDDALLRPLAAALQAVDPSAGAVVADAALLVNVSTSVGEQVDELRAAITDAAAPLTALGLTVVAVSPNILVADVMDELQRSQITGLATTLLVSMLILAVAFWFRAREPLLGVLAIGSVAVVVAWTLGLMAATGIPFNVMTAMVSALAIGIGVPFGIHVVNRYLEDRERYADLGEVIDSTLRHTGGALIGSATTTIAGFGSLALSAVPPFRQFGIVVAMTIGLALLSSIVVLPALLSTYERSRSRRASARVGAAPAVAVAAGASGLHGAPQGAE